MTKARSYWDLIYLIVIAIGIPTSAYHFYSGRYAQGIMAAGAVIFGLFILATKGGTQEFPAIEARQPRPRGVRLRTGASADELRREGLHVSGRFSGAVLAGFAATTVMTLALIPAYIAAGIWAIEDGNQIERWFWGLTHNDLTNGVFDIPIGAISVNLLAGLVWALIYAYLGESRLQGPGWWRGLRFSLLPWALSLVVFFPAVGAGFLGMDLDAGPLPAIGNLVLHLIFGATLGVVYALPEVNPAEDRPDDVVYAKMENDGIAVGLLGGLSIGLIVGLVLGLFVGGDEISGTNIALLCGAAGTVIGGIIGPFIGLGVGERQQNGA
jgi:hypothetical protein